MNLYRRFQRRRVGRQLRDDRGSMAAAELPFGVLWIVATALVVLSLPTWMVRQNAANGAARDAARVVVTADSWSDGTTAAHALTGETATNHGLETSDLRLSLDGSLTRGSEVTATVRTTVPAISLPLGIQAGSVTYTASHTERVDDHRSL